MKNYKLNVLNFIKPEFMSEKAEWTALKLNDILGDTIINASDINVLWMLISGLAESEDVASVSLIKYEHYEMRVYYDLDRIIYTSIVLEEAYDDNLFSPLMTEIIGDMSQIGLLYMLGRRNDRKEDK